MGCWPLPKQALPESHQNTHWIIKLGVNNGQACRTSGGFGGAVMSIIQREGCAV